MRAAGISDADRHRKFIQQKKFEALSVVQEKNQGQVGDTGSKVDQFFDLAVEVSLSFGLTDCLEIFSKRI